MHIEINAITFNFSCSFLELLEHYPENHSDHTDCQGTLVMLSRTTEIVRQHLPESENMQLLCELQRDLGSFSALVQKDRLFIRQGCLLKHSKRGLQQRIFFLVSCVNYHCLIHFSQFILYFSFPMCYYMEPNLRSISYLKSWDTFQCVHYLQKMQNTIHSLYLAGNEQLPSVQALLLRKLFGWPNCPKRLRTLK